MYVYESDQQEMESATAHAAPIAKKEKTALSPALPSPLKRWIKNSTLQDKFLIVGVAVSLGWLAIQFASTPPQIVKNQPVQFDPQLLQAFSDADYQQFMGNFKAFLADQSVNNLVQRAIEYRDAAKNFANDKNNDECFGSRTRNECLSSFLINRAGELQQVEETPGDTVTMQLTKSEARELIRSRVESILTAAHNVELKDIPPADNSLLLQTQIAANAIRQKERASLEGQSRETLTEAEGF